MFLTTRQGSPGKCPKCGELIRIPQASAANALASAAKATTARQISQLPKRVAPANAPAKAATVPTSDEPSLRPNSQNIKALLEEVGLAKRVGSFCPNCDKPFAQGAVFCIKCGLNFATGEKSNQYELESTRLEFDNMHLNEAAEMMKRDQALASRMLNAGVPWWVILCVLLSGLLIVATGCLLVEAAQGGARPTDTPHRSLAGLSCQMDLVRLACLQLCFGERLCPYGNHRARLSRIANERAHVPFRSRLLAHLRHDAHQADSWNGDILLDCHGRWHSSHYLYRGDGPTHLMRLHQSNAGS